MLNRRQLLTGLGAGAVVAGFDPVSRTWATAGPFERIPSLDGTLHLDEPTRTENSVDNGRYVTRRPAAVLRPGSVRDIQRMVQFCRGHRIPVATRGQGHSTHGQGLVTGLLIESRSLATIHSIGTTTADVDAGVTWRDLLHAAIGRGLTPPVLTGYLGLSIGGTLSMGGTSSSPAAGLLVDRVRELEVVTGTGQLVRCSATRYWDLFESVLAGIGQFGIITRATVELVPALPMTRMYTIRYPDNPTFFTDLRKLTGRGELDDVWGQWFPGDAGFTYNILAAISFDPADPPDDDRLLRDLTASASAVDLSFRDFALRVDTYVDQLRQTIDWDDLVKPWLDVWLPGTEIERYVDEVIPTVTSRDVGPGGFMLLFPMLRSSITRPMYRIPSPDGDPYIYLFNILTSSAEPGPDPDFAAEMLNRNHRLFSRAREVGGVRYPIDSIPFTRSDWTAHYGSRWADVVRRKQRYDPDNVLTPGPGIF